MLSMVELQQVTSRQRPAHLGERLLLELTNSLARQVVFVANLLERQLLLGAQAETLAQVTALIPTYTTAINAAINAKAVQAAAVAAANTAITAVIKHIRDIWVAVKRRTVREELAVAGQVYYGLTLDGKQPQITAQATWLSQAAQIIQGEAAAVAAGYPALAAPTIAQLQTRLTAAQTAASQRATAKTSYDNSLAALSTLGQQVDDLIATAMHELRLALRTETASSRREIMRSYGARFSEKTEDESGEVPIDEPVAEENEEEIETLFVPTAMSMHQPYAVPAVNGNGTAVRV